MLAHSASSLHAGAFAPYARRQGGATTAADALSDALTALARREVQLSALLDIARALEQDLKQARTARLRCLDETEGVCARERGAARGVRAPCPLAHALHSSARGAARPCVRVLRGCGRAGGACACGAGASF
jgi:hypothetical protein